MTEHTHDLPLAFWENNLEELDGEIARLAMLCAIRILEPGAVQRVLQKDASVCGTDNPIAFAKLRGLLMMHLAIREKSVDSLDRRRRRGSRTMSSTGSRSASLT